MNIIEPQSGSIGLIKAPHAAKATGVTLFHPDFEQVYNKLDNAHQISAAMTGKFDYHWEYIQEEDAYLLEVNYFKGDVNVGVKFAKERAGQILQNLLEKEQRVVTIILKFKEESNKLFEDAVVLMGMEIEILPEAGWPTV
ncbi:MAG: hypothetical protein FH758_09595 [Firmicutes bacterium]|nr:hypothetical protein [Bacillota bacterium]